MARRRKTATRVVHMSAPRSAAPIINIRQPKPVRRRRSHAPRRRRRAAPRSRSRGFGSLGGIVSSSALDMFLGGAMYGFVVKQGLVQKLPAIPYIGRTGTAAILLDFWARRGGGEWVRKGAVAAAVMAGYQLGNTGSITGDSHLVTSGMAMPPDFTASGDYAEGDYAEGDYAEGDLDGDVEGLETT